RGFLVSLVGPFPGLAGAHHGGLVRIFPQFDQFVAHSSVGRRPHRHRHFPLVVGGGLGGGAGGHHLAAFDPVRPHLVVVRLAIGAALAAAKTSAPRDDDGSGRPSPTV